jgi:hypothetical protein
LSKVREHGAILDVSSRSARVRLTKPLYFAISFQTIHCRLLTPWNKRGTLFFLCSRIEEAGMLKTFVEEAAALASIVLFVGMIAVWAQLIPQL